MSGLQNELSPTKPQERVVGQPLIALARLLARQVAREWVQRAQLKHHVHHQSDAAANQVRGSSRPTRWRPTS